MNFAPACACLSLLIADADYIPLYYAAVRHSQRKRSAATVPSNVTATLVTPGAEPCYTLSRFAATSRLAADGESNFGMNRAGTISGSAGDHRRSQIFEVAKEDRRFKLKFNSVPMDRDTKERFGFGAGTRCH